MPNEALSSPSCLDKARYFHHHHFQCQISSLLNSRKKKTWKKIREFLKRKLRKEKGFLRFFSLKRKLPRKWRGGGRWLRVVMESLFRHRVKSNSPMRCWHVLYFGWRFYAGVTVLPVESRESDSPGKPIRLRHVAKLESWCRVCKLSCSLRCLHGNGKGGPQVNTLYVIMCVVFIFSYYRLIYRLVKA